MPGRLGRRPGPAQISGTNADELDEDLEDVDADGPTPAAKKTARKKA
jgi:hypothetical protein